MIIVNDIKFTNADNMNLYDFLSREKYNLKLIAVECNKIIIPKSQYENTILKDGDRLEVVTFVGGG